MSKIILKVAIVIAVILALLASESVRGQEISDDIYDNSLYSEIQLLELEKEIEEINLEIAEKTTLLTYLYSESTELKAVIAACGCTREKKKELELTLVEVDDDIQVVQTEISDLQDRLIDIQEQLDNLF